MRNFELQIISCSRRRWADTDYLQAIKGLPIVTVAMGSVLKLHVGVSDQSSRKRMCKNLFIDSKCFALIYMRI